MKKTLNIDAALLAKAHEWSGAPRDTATIHPGLKSLVQQIAAQRMIALLGSEPDALDHEKPRRREAAALILPQRLQRIGARRPPRRQPRRQHRHHAKQDDRPRQ